MKESYDDVTLIKSGACYSDPDARVKTRTTTTATLRHVLLLHTVHVLATWHFLAVPITLRILEMTPDTSARSSCEANSEFSSSRDIECHMD